MPDCYAPLNELLAQLQLIALRAMCEKLKALVICADWYLEALKSNTQDESLAHLREIRTEALALLEELGGCDKFPTTDGFEPGKHAQIRERYEALCALVEFAFVLRNPQRVEELHAAL
jgi:hypothetical protein